MSKFHAADADRYTAVERTLLTIVAFALLIALTHFGWSDSPAGMADAIAKPATLETETASEEPSAATTAKTYTFDGPRDAIVEGHIPVDVMEIVAPRRVIELTLRLEKSMRENPDWWLEQVKKRNPGEPLPYDSRMGLSESEYHEFLALAKKMTTRKKAEATLIIEAKNDDVYVLDGRQALPDISGIEIDLKNDLIRTPFGILTERSEINATEDSAFGAWVGVQWKFEELDPNSVTGTVAKFSVGKLKPSGRGVIFYEVIQSSVDGKTHIEYVF